MEKPMEKQNKFSFFIAGTPKELLANAMEIARKIYNDTGKLNPMCAMCFEAPNGERAAILVAMGINPGKLSLFGELGKRLGMMKLIHDIKDAPYFITLADTAGVELDRKIPEQAKIIKEIEANTLKPQDIPAQFKSEGLLIAITNKKRKALVKRLEKKRSISFIGGDDMMSTTTTLVEDVKFKPEGNDGFAEMFFDGFEYGESEKTVAAKKFIKVLKALDAQKEFEAMKKNKKNMGINPERIEEQISDILKDFPKEVKDQLFIELVR